MKRVDTISAALVVVGFAGIWLPLGQTVFLAEHWMRVGVFMMPFLLAFAIQGLGERRQSFHDARLSSVIALSLYILHQAEEHWVDLFGNHYAFQPFLNATLSALVGAGQNELVVTKLDIFFINTSLVWLTGLIAALSPSNQFPGLAFTGLLFVNAISHMMSAIAMEAYNPGLLTSILLFMPFAVWRFFRAIREHSDAHRLIMASITWALVAHGILMIGLVLVRYANSVAPAVYYTTLIFWSLTPLLAFRQRKV